MSSQSSSTAAVSAPATPAVAVAAPAAAPAKALKICCACPETRKPRDECVVKFGEDNCKDFIEAHKVCLRSQGFKV